MWIGSLKSCEDQPLGVKWQTCVKFLGIHITYDIKLSVEKNFKQRLKKIKNMINLWKVRGLSIHGKLTIIKAFLLSKMIYPSSVLTTPPCGAFFQVWCILRNVRMSAKCRAFF